MTLQRKLERLISELQDIRDECRYTNEQAQLDVCINRLQDIYITSDGES
jgi:hypothetical protein